MPKYIFNKLAYMLHLVKYYYSYMFGDERFVVVKHQTQKRSKCISRDEFCNGGEGGGFGRDHA